MIRYLLDTNAVSDLVRNPIGKIAQRLGLVRGADALTSIVVAAELRFGAVRINSARLMSQLETVFQRLPVMPLEPPIDEIYASVRNDLERAGTPIGANDMLIAAHALPLDCILVTDNEGEFRRVPGLSVENWLRSD